MIGKAEVHISSGMQGMEFFVKNSPQFKQAGTHLDWTWTKPFSEFVHILTNFYKLTWLEV